MSDLVKPLALPLPDSNNTCKYWSSLPGDMLAYYLVQAAISLKSPMLYIADDAHQASMMMRALRFFAHNIDLTIAHLPEWEILPYDQFSVHPEIISDRLSLLSKLPSMRQSIIVTSGTNLIQRLPPQSFFNEHIFSLACGDRLNLEAFRARLADAGYYAVSQVNTHGEFAIRGSIIDIFPMGASTPIRLDLFDEDIESIRLFDIESQLTIEKIDALHLLPAHEFSLDEEAIERFRRQFREQFHGNPMNCPLYEQVSAGTAPQGIDYHFPLFHERTATLFDYLPEHTHIVFDEAMHQSMDKFWRDLGHRYDQRAHNITLPILPPTQLFLPPAEALNQCKQWPCIQIREQANAVKLPARPLPELHVEQQAKTPLQKVTQFMNSFEGRVLFLVDSAGRRETVSSLLARADIIPTSVSDWPTFMDSQETYGIAECELAHGGILDNLNIAIICEGDLFAHHAAQRRRARTTEQDPNAIIKNLAELSIGSPVVHIEHGVGRYQGLTNLQFDDRKEEYLLLSYANDDKLYVPITNLDLIARYTGADPDNAPLHKLGSNQWKKATSKAMKRAQDVAAQLLDIYAKRAARPGFEFKQDIESYQKFCSDFPFEETPDQAQAIKQVVQDMTAKRSMDRLICGDVGFGKTEVAIRAAFICAQNQKQVAVLAPTTLLVEQHYQSFCDRFAPWPIRIGKLSRFANKAETEQTLAALKAGKIDIVIGTHKLLQPDVTFNDLALLVIDEEHRFGVRQKERLKALRAEVDILTLTATPIPRTLNMAFAGIRDLSIIATPPLRRLSVNTSVHTRNDVIITEAISRELLRGGQVFFLHNTVESIERVANDLQALVPDAKISVAHGQMPERTLENIMSDFYHHRSNILVCTTIIETGIDIPSANTIIIDRADKFGLAALHQLRGRVGRSHHQAYAYLLIPDPKAISNDSKKRLEAITVHDDLGIGFTLATQDLEIRGAGDLLGDQQSGEIHDVGFTLYLELIERAVKSLKAGKTPELDLAKNTRDINLQVSALLPDTYISDVHLRLTLYKRINHCSDDEKLIAMREEMVDRFGPLPKPAVNLFEQMRIKNRMGACDIDKIDCTGHNGYLVFKENAKVDPSALVEMVTSEPGRYAFVGPSKFRFGFDCDGVDEEEYVRVKFECVHNMLDKLIIT